MIKLVEILREAVDQDNDINVEESLYDKVINYELNTDTIPKVHKKYTLGKSTQVHPKDLEIYKKLYAVSPPKEGEEIGSAGSKGSGNGEIALYWLLKSSGYSDIIDSRKSNQPDLKVNGIGIEVKSFDTKSFKLGRYASVQPAKNLLNSLFSIYKLLEASTKKKEIDSSNFNIDELKHACEEVIKFFDSANDHPDIKVFPIVNNAYKIVRIIFTKVSKQDERHTAETLAAGLFKMLLEGVLKNKPGIPGYFVNVTKDGKIEYHHVTEEKINNISDEKILSKGAIAAEHSFIRINPEILF